MSDHGATRVFGQHGGSGVVVIGLKRRPLRDVYHWLVTGSWTRLIVVFAAVYFLTLGLFGAARLLVALRLPLEGSLLEALSRAAVAPVPEVSALSARGVAAGALAALDGFVHWVELVIASGIVLAKFSLVRARVLFSNVAVVAPHEGSGQALMFRMANERTSHIVDARVTVMLVRNEVQDGEPVRRGHDLDLVRGRSAIFSHAWTLIHPAGRGSPLQGESAASLEAAQAEVIVNLSGFDEALMKTVHARHVYRASRIRFGARFREISKQLPDGRHAIDYRKFHKAVSVDEGAAPERDRTPTRRER